MEKNPIFLHSCEVNSGSGLGGWEQGSGSLCYCLHTAPTQGSLEQTLSSLLYICDDIVTKQREAELE